MTKKNKDREPIKPAGKPMSDVQKTVHQQLDPNVDYHLSYAVNADGTRGAAAACACAQGANHDA
jgi:hypothetical protein